MYAFNIVLLLLLFWSVLWYLYNRFLRSKEFHPMGTEVIHTPRWLSCAIPYVSWDPKKNKCENVKFDGWSLGHIAIYFTIGLVFPGHYGAMLALSIACEIFEYAVGWRARWLVDPIANMIGYALGHAFFIDLSRYPIISESYVTSVTALIALGVILALNRPAMIPGAQSFY